MKRNAFRMLAVLGLVAMSANRGVAQEFEEETVRLSSQVLKEIMAIPVKGIPESLLADAQGIAIVPAMIKGGFIVGAQHGHGVVLSRDDAGNWKAPTFVTVTGGSVGWQAGVQSTDLILVFRNKRGVEGLLRGKVKFGVDASVAAGPVGRQASAATDTQLKAEILSWSRSRGLFAGVSIDGGVVQVDRRSNGNYYAVKPGDVPGIPQSAFQLMEQVRAFSGPLPKGNPAIAPSPFGGNDAEALRKNLAETSRRMQGLLDETWQKHLALPADIYDASAPASRDVLAQCVTRYRTVAGDARYQKLAERPEFQETYSLLIRYQAASAQPATANPGSIPLPPPPP
ncbi:MAG: lipid-binding SYLF domain-containing protein [Gemmataceae bacterium]|nr:lipid-binding SYLF domain-containing protein [Gemmataceae bacterium]